MPDLEEVQLLAAGRVSRGSGGLSDNQMGVTFDRCLRLSLRDSGAERLAYRAY